MRSSPALALAWLAWPAVLIGAGPGCARIDDAVDGAPPPPRDAGIGIVFDLSSESQGCVAQWTASLTPRPADLLILFDRSDSMNMAFGSGSRYQALSGLLSDVVNRYQSRVRFGYEEMPGRGPCEGQPDACCASSPSVPLALDNAPALVAAFAQAAPVAGSTPTAAALLQARSYYDALDDGIDNRYVLLATDGVPSCTLAGALAAGADSSSGACLDALAEVQGLVTVGVKVIVLAVGEDAAASSDQTGCLDLLAHAGGAALSPGSPGYYSASDPDLLQSAIAQIFGAVGRPSCVLDMSAVDNPTLAAVYLDGQEIPVVPAPGDGWHWESSSSHYSIRITGAYCEEIQDYRVSSYEVKYGCGPSSSSSSSSSSPQRRAPAALVPTGF